MYLVKTAQFFRSTRIVKPNNSTIFLLSSVLVSAGNYLYNLVLGRLVGPEVFAETGLMVTGLLLMSFLGMAFQIVGAKFIIEMPRHKKTIFRSVLTIIGFSTGLLFALLLSLKVSPIQSFFNLSSKTIIYTFAAGLPFYLVMSAQRGFLQGKKDFKKLSASYLSEMTGRFLVTFILLLVFGFSPVLSVAIGLTASIAIGSYFSGPLNFQFKWAISLNNIWVKRATRFFLFTAGYEFVQIMVNYFDVLIVKHFFENEMAGFYTSLSLIGRMVYFVTWMFVMLLLPEVIRLNKDNKPFKPVLNRYLLWITLFIISVLLISKVFSYEIVNLMFGIEYLFIAPLLWKYSLATGLFSLTNVFVYFYLSLNNYKPVIITGLLALIQSAGMYYFHKDLEQVIDIQIYGMMGAFVAILTYHISRKQNA